MGDTIHTNNMNKGDGATYHQQNGITVTGGTINDFHDVVGIQHNYEGSANKKSEKGTLV